MFYLFNFSCRWRLKSQKQLVISHLFATLLCSASYFSQMANGRTKGICMNCTVTPWLAGKHIKLSVVTVVRLCDSSFLGGFCFEDAEVACCC